MSHSRVCTGLHAARERERERALAVGRCVTALIGAAVSAGCSDSSLAAILAARPAPVPTCADAVENGAETDVDCGGTSCAPCDTGKSCVIDRDCATACIAGYCWTGRSCAEIHAQRPALPNGAYRIDPGTPGPRPIEVYCAMGGEAWMSGGGWTRVAFEPPGAGGAAVEGALTYLGRNLGAPSPVPQPTAPGLIGLRLASAYREVAITWGDQFIRFTPGSDIFVDQVDLQIAITNFATSDTLLNEWVLAAGGASFCRASKHLDVRPGDTSWAVKPLNSTGTGCRCNEQVWLDRGAFYGGGVPRTSCGLDRGGAWSGVKDIREPKAGLVSDTPLSIWTR